MINLKTAKALGLTIPPGMLAIADEVIEEDVVVALHQDAIDPSER